MYCVIQKFENKKTNTWVEAKELKVDITKWFADGIEKISYGYSYSGKFERPVKTAYKISIHKSYRKDGKVKKKQWVICTIGYYTMLECWLGDCVVKNELNIKLKDMDITEEELWDRVYEKFQPILDEVTKEYEATEEYKTKVKHMAILKKYREAKEMFEAKYGKNTYEYCYDIFGVLRNEKYLKELEASYKTQQEYKSSYYESSKSNYSNFDFSNILNSKPTYTDKEKEYLKKIYKGGALNLHPDKTKDDGEGMKFLNKLKEEWGIK
jgi:hypothetical protein